MILQWSCKCGTRMWLHHENCSSCGAAKPAPPPETPPSDDARPEAPWRMPAGCDPFASRLAAIWRTYAR